MHFAFCFFYDYFMAFAQALFIFDFHRKTRIANGKERESKREIEEEKNRYP